MRNLLEKALKSNDKELLRLVAKFIDHPLTKFHPRPDQPELLDQQTSFYDSSFAGITCALGGNGSGKSYCGAAKVARFLETIPPPEKDTPFWVLNKTMELATANSWGQNLYNFIPRSRISAIYWYREARNLPRALVLKPHKNGNNYVIEIKSYDQGRQALQSSNIAGFWADEQCPFDVLNECLVRTRKWNFTGNQIYTLTPLEPDLELEERFNERQQYPHWSFFRFNTRCNKTLKQSAVEEIENETHPGLVETRLTGAFARYEGMIYPTFGKEHLCEPFQIPRSWKRIRGLDLGWNHCTACLWCALEPDTGRHIIYREYNKPQTSVENHVNSINGQWQDINPEIWAELPYRGSTYADPANPQVLHEFRLRGLTTKIADKNRDAGFATVRSLLRPDPDGKPLLQIFNTCTCLISQLRTYVYDPKTGKPIKETDQRLFDLCDSLRYLTHTYRIQGHKEEEPQKTRKQIEMEMMIGD